MRRDRKSHKNRAPAGLPASRVKTSGEHQALAFGFGDEVAKFAGGIDPQLDGHLGVCQGRFRRTSMGHAARQLRHIGNESLGNRSLYPDLLADKL